MYYREHAPPHFHAEYGGVRSYCGGQHRCRYGEFPRRALHLVLEWYSLHKAELAENWSLAQAKNPLKPIEPLE